MADRSGPAGLRCAPLRAAGALSRRGVVSAAGAYVVAAPQAGAALRRGGIDPAHPPGEPTVAFAAADRTSGPQAMRLDSMSHLRVVVSVCGEEVSAVLDTGAARSVIDRGFARRLGLAVRPGFNVAGITGDAYGDFAEGVTVGIGRLSLEHFTPGVLDLTRVSPSTDDSVPIILGRELFQRTVAEFDFAASRVAFREASAGPEPSAGVLPLGQTARGTPHIPISIEGGAEIQAGLDIGYNGSLLVSPDYAEQAGLLAGRPLSDVASVGAEGMSIDAVVTARGLALAGVTLAQAPVEVPRRWNRSVPAIVGLDVIKKFRMLTDYAHGRIGLFADPSQLASPLPKDRSGIGALPTREGLKVIHVASGSPAERCGLRVGDGIAAVDGEPVTLAYVRDHPRMGARPAGSTFHLQLDDGRSVQLILADYY